MCEWNMIVCNVVEEVDVSLVEHETGGNRVHGCITPSLVEETAVLVEALKKVKICLRPKPVKVANLKVRPL